MRKIALLILSIFILSGCAVCQKMTTNDFGAENLERGMDNLVIIRTEGLIKGKIDKATQDAIAIPIGNGYVIALSHATRIETSRIVRTPFGIITTTRVVLKTNWFIGDKEVELVGRKDDISLFRIKLPGDVTEVFPYEFGDSDRIRVGDKIVVMGYPFGLVVCVKQGVIGLPQFADEEQKHQILVNALINPGDSGSPLLTIQDGTLKMIGIVCAIYGKDGLGVAFPINYIKDCIKEITCK